MSAADEDVYATGWDHGYSQALMDLSAEADRCTSVQMTRVTIERLRYQTQIRRR